MANLFINPTAARGFCVVGRSLLPRYGTHSTSVTQMIANMVVVFGSGGGIYISGGFVLVILLVVVVMKLL